MLKNPAMVPPNISTNKSLIVSARSPCIFIDVILLRVNSKNSHKTPTKATKDTKIIRAFMPPEKLIYISSFIYLPNKYRNRNATQIPPVKCIVISNHEISLYKLNRINTTCIDNIVINSQITKLAFFIYGVFIIIFLTTGELFLLFSNHISFSLPSLNPLLNIQKP